MPNIAPYIIAIRYENGVGIRIYLYAHDDILPMGFEPKNYEPYYREAVTISNVISLNGAEEVGVVK